MNLFLEKQSIFSQINPRLKQLMLSNPNRYDNTHNKNLVCIGKNNWINITKLKTLNIHELCSDPSITLNPFVLLRKVTINTQYRDFQFKLLHNVTCTRDKLFKFKYIPDNYCISCLENLEIRVKDDISHSFVNCPVTSDTWNNFKTVVLQKLSSNINLSHKNIIEGFPNQPTIINELSILIKKNLHKPMTCRKVLSVQHITRLFDELSKIKNCIKVMKANKKVN